MERVGANSVVGVMLSAGAFARLTTSESTRTLLARTQGLNPAIWAAGSVAAEKNRRVLASADR